MKPLSHEERQLLATLLARDASEKAALVEANIQAARYQMIDERRQVIDQTAQEKVKQDQLPYVSAQRAGRSTVILGPKQALPTPPQPQPSSWFRQRFQDWVIRKWLADRHKKSNV
jgi:hypothetical protein